MCCEETKTLDLPPEVIGAIAHYRQLLGDRGWDWGDDRPPDFFRWARFSLLGPVFEAFAEHGDWPRAVRAVVGDRVPAGVVVVRVDEDGALHADAGPARPAVPERPVPVDVVIDSAARGDLHVAVAGHDVHVPTGGAALQPLDVDGAAFTVALGDRSLVVSRAVRTAAAARLRLTSPRFARWSVTDTAGGAWFPDGVPRKWDVHHRPYFHAHDVTFDVPAEPLRVVCTRGLEYERVEREVRPDAGHTLGVACEPRRLIDPAADGWYGGDLHIHMNYSGDLVCEPEDAARMQLGEGLHLANLVAANGATTLVYDREMLEAYAGTDLPWSRDDAVARMGVEYRNDLLGHVHALGPTAPPRHYYAGHERSDRPDDWPPNSVACEELRDLGATVGYAHPSFTDFPDWSAEQFFAAARTCEARELVADAALGLVDSVDLISPFNDEGAAFLYHRLLSCGLRLAATAGTDVFLSLSHGPGVASNPPGWGRVYARLGDRPLTVAAFQDAVRAGRTVVTNGPWLSLEVDGRGPGSVLDADMGDRLTVRARTAGAGAATLTVVGPDGVLAEGDASAGLELGIRVEEPTWLAALARGPGHPNTLDERVFAHTTAVYVDVAGDRVGKAADARWCLDLLDTLERFAGEHGRFAPHARDERLGDLVGVLDRAREFYRALAGP